MLGLIDPSLHINSPAYLALGYIHQYGTNGDPKLERSEERCWDRGGSLFEAQVLGWDASKIFVCRPLTREAHGDLKIRSVANAKEELHALQDLIQEGKLSVKLLSRSLPSTSFVTSSDPSC
jgi:hypothetical protein